MKKALSALGLLTITLFVVMGIAIGLDDLQAAQASSLEQAPPAAREMLKHATVFNATAEAPAVPPQRYNVRIAETILDAAVEDGELYMATSDHRILVLDAATNDIITKETPWPGQLHPWEFRQGNGHLVAFTTSDDGSILAVLK